MRERQEQKTMQEQLISLGSDLKVAKGKRTSDLQEQTDGVQRGYAAKQKELGRMIGEAVGDAAIAHSLQLGQPAEGENVSSESKKIRAEFKGVSTKDIVHRLHQNPGENLTIYADGGNTEVKVRYEDGKGFFYEWIKGGTWANVEPISESKISNILKHNSFKIKMDVNESVKKVPLDADGNHVKPAVKEADVAISQPASDASEDSEKIVEGELMPTQEEKAEESGSTAVSDVLVEPMTGDPERDKLAKYRNTIVHGNRADNAKEVIPSEIASDEPSVDIEKTPIERTPDEIFQEFYAASRNSKSYKNRPNVLNNLVSSIESVRSGDLSLESLKDELKKEHYGLYTRAEKLIKHERAVNGIKDPDTVLVDKDDVEGDVASPVNRIPDAAVIEKDDVLPVAKGAIEVVSVNDEFIESDNSSSMSPEFGSDVLKNKIFGKDRKTDDLEGGEKFEPIDESRLVDLEKIATEKNIEALRERLDAARRDYAQMDYKKTSAWDSMKRFFGKSLSSNMDTDADIVEMEARYQNALLDYKNARLDAVRGDGVSQEDLKKGFVEVLREISFDERRNLYESRIDAKTPLWLVGKAQGAIDWYRGRSFKEKLAMSGVMMIGGVALGVGGGAAAASVAFLARRAFGGAVTGRGIFEFGEALSQRSLDKKAEEEVSDAGKEIASNENLEEMLASMNEKLDASIFSSDEKLDSMMKSRTRNTVAGFAAGTFLAFGGPQYLMEKFSHFGSVAEVPTASDVAVPAEHVLVPEAAPVTETVVEHIEKPIELVIQPGSGQSIEGQLIRHLIESGYDKSEVGGMAHRMVGDYIHVHGGSMESLSKILSGKIELSPDSLHIQSLETTPLHKMAGQAAAEVHSRLSVPSVASENVALPHAAEEVVQSAPAASVTEKVIEATEVADKASIAREIVSTWFSGEGAASVASEIKSMTIAQMQNESTGKYTEILKRIIETAKDAGVRIRPEQTPLQVMASATQAYLEKKSVTA